MSIPGRWCVAAALATGFGVVAPVRLVAVVVGVVVASALVQRPRRRIGVLTLVVLTVLGAVAGWVADRRGASLDAADLGSGAVQVVIAIREDPLASTDWTAVGNPIQVDGREWDGPPVAVGPLPPDVRSGDVVQVDGAITDRPHRIGRHRVAGSVAVRRIVEVSRGGGPIFAIGNWLRDRVRASFERDDAVDGLITGLLIGDIERMTAAATEDLRRSGLAHFVAVSGSNVALFLGAWWLVGAPLAIHPRLRAAYGFVGLAVFVVVTRWEPSVIRASVMAAVPLVGGLLSIPIDPWMALGTAVTILLLVSADLASSVGFILSVVATAGVLVGVGVVRNRRPAWLWVPLGASLGAQVAVAPVLLSVFGTVPLVAPIANLAAAPVVALTSTLAIASVVVPIGLVADVTRLGASLVLVIADVAAGGPQLSTAGVVGVGILGIAIAHRSLRPLGLAGVAIVLLAVSPASERWPLVPTLVALDVGQGDSLLLLDPAGHAVLVDGGSDVGLLDRALRRHGVERFDVVVATHGDTDHAAGLEEVVGFGALGELWLPASTDDPLLGRLASLAVDRGIPVRRVEQGHRRRVGSFMLDVLGPARRFLSDNDGSVVILATARRTALLPGDIEAVAQATLPPVRPDVLIVPHHGSATTDPRWLARTVGPVAVLSYGPNRYGHPSGDILDVLTESGAIVHHTHFEGDIVISLG